MDFPQDSVSEEINDNLRQAIGDYRHHEIERKLVANALSDLKQFHLLTQLKEEDLADWTARATYMGLTQIFKESHRAGRAAVSEMATLAWLGAHEKREFRKAGDDMLAFLTEKRADWIGDTEYQLLIGHVQSMALRRRLKEFYDMAQAMLKKVSLTPDQLHRFLVRGFQKAWGGFSNRAEPKNEGEIWRELADRKALEESKGLTEETPEEKEQQRLSARYATPWGSLNSVLTGGFGAGQYMIVAARPHMGKSAFTKQLMRHLIKVSGQSGLLVSLEMDNISVGKRTIAQQLQKPYKMMHSADMYSASELHSSGLMVDDQAYRNVEDLCRQVEMLKMAHPDLLWVAVDYAQLLAPSDHALQAEVSRRLHRLRGELKVGVIVVLQIGRDVEKRKDTRPLLSDIKESGQYEQDADIALMLWRPHYYNEKHGDPNEAWCFVRKQRDGGGTGDAKFAYNGALLSFYEPKSAALSDETRRECQQALTEVPNLF